MKKKVTMQTIADHLNISKSTVSKALSNKYSINEETKAKVLATASRLGYKTNSSKMKIKSSVNGAIALIMLKDDLTDSEYWGKVIKAAEEELSKKSISLIIATVEGPENSNVEVPSCILERQVDGALIIGRVKKDIIQRIDSMGIPIVLVDTDDFPVLKLDHVLADNYHGGYKAANYLINNNHRRIGFIGDLSYSYSFKERYRGFTAAVSDFERVNPDEDIKLMNVIKKSNDKNIPAVISKVKQMLESGDHPTAFFCGNDPVAIKVLNVMNEMGINCPEDISLIGFDNLEKCNWVYPKLTSIDACKEKLGVRSVELLLRRMEQKNERHECVMIMTEVFKRESIQKL